MDSSVFRSAFCRPSDPANISVFESETTGLHTLVEKNFSDNEQFTQHIQNNPCPKLRIVSLCAPISIKPLKISKSAFEAIAEKYSVGEELRDLAAKFGDKPRSAGAGDEGITIQTSENGIQDITYGVTFPVQAVATSLDSWTMRQIGVFHRYDPNELQNLWVFFHVGLNTPAQTDIRHYASQISHQTAESTWVALHSAALFNYLPSWHSYIHYLGWKVDKIVDHALTEEGNSVWTTEKDKKLRELHQYSDVIFPIQFRLQAAIKTLTGLEEMNNIISSRLEGTSLGLSEFRRLAKYHKTRIQGLVTGTEVLSYKVQEALSSFKVSVNLGLSSKMLDLNNRLLAVNDELLQLGNESFDDNATVKVVTLVTLIYLPASLVSTILGMNLFKFDDGTTDEFKVSKHFWIFIVATVLLALVTLGLWYAWSHKERIRRSRPRLSPRLSRHMGRKEIDLQTLKAVKI